MYYDPPLPSIYIMSCFNLVKIGVSRDPEARREALIFSPYLSLYRLCTETLPLVIDYRLETENAFAVEKIAHTLLKDYALGQEWFNVNIDIAIGAVKHAVEEFEKKSQRISTYKEKNLTCVSVYLDSEEIELLRGAAKADARSPANLAKQIITLYLKKTVKSASKITA